MFNVFEEEELVQEGPGIPSQVPVHFVVVTPRAGQLDLVMATVQKKIIDPLVQRKILLEFRVRDLTPASFVAEAATLVVLELVVPVPWPITDWDVQDWRRQLGHEMGLVVAPGLVRHQLRDGDEQRAKVALARAMVLPPAAHKADETNAGASWVGSCVERDKSQVPRSQITTVPAMPPKLVAVDDATGKRRSLESGTTLLTTDTADALKDFLPAYLQWKSSWRLAYSLRLHGVSLKTFYRRMQREGPSLLVIQDHQGHVFGGFAASAWRLGDRYYGTGESFVFRFRQPKPKPVVSARVEPSSEKDRSGTAQAAVDEAMQLLDSWHTKVKEEAARADLEAARCGRVMSATEALDALLEPGSDAIAPPEAEEELEDLEVFHHSSEAKDAFFLFSDAECLAMGGGSGFALYLEKDFLHGRSDPCSTFQSEVLSCDRNFIIGDLECWVFEDPTLIK